MCQSLSYGYAVASESAAGEFLVDGQHVVAAAADQTVVAVVQEKLPWEASYPTAVVSPYMYCMCSHAREWCTVGLACYCMQCLRLCLIIMAVICTIGLLRSRQLLHMQTLYACKDFSAYPVESKHTGHDAPTSLTGAYTLARDSSHASTRSRGPADAAGGG